MRGVGPWTSEMFLMFAYKRLDVFSIGDIALRRAVSEIYDVSDQEDQKEIVSIDFGKMDPIQVCSLLVFMGAFGRLNLKVVSDTFSFPITESSRF